MKPIPERVEEIVAESYFKFVMTDPDEADAGAEWLKTEITLALTETDQQAREEERERTRQIVLSYTPPHFTRDYKDTDHMRDNILKALSNPPSQV